MDDNGSLFVLSSAIHTRFGVFDTKTRFEQTLDTCKSIKKYAPNSTIALLESGAKPLETEYKDKLKDYGVVVYNYTNHPDVVGVTKVDNHDIVKNVVETIVFSNFYMALFDDNKKRPARIFKMSSRYVLNDNFDYNYHMQARDKIVIKGPYTSQFDPKITGGATSQYMARLYSFDYSLLPYMMCVYQNSLANMIERINNKGYIDIEHCLFKYIKSNFDNFTDKNIGVEGIIAPMGKHVSE